MTTHFVGIDISAASLQVAIDSKGKLWEGVFKNNAAGHKALLKRLTKKGRRARVVMEATAFYGLDLALALDNAVGVEVMVANPRTLAAFAKATAQRGKSDPLDARTLREFAQRMPFLPWQAPTTHALELRQVMRRLHQLVHDRTQEKNRLHAAQSSEALPAVVVEDLQAHIAQLDARIERLEAAGLSVARADVELCEKLGLLESIPGIGTRSGLHILGELCLLPSDMTVRQWVAHAGLDPSPRQSGTSLKKSSRISKSGNRYLRHALYMPALVSLRHNAHVKGFYEKLLSRGKAPKQAVVAIMRKLLHAIWGMFKSKQPFDASRFYKMPETA